MSDADGTAGGLLQFVGKAGRQGYMNPSTAKAYQGTVSRVFEAVFGETWAQTSTDSLDVEDLIRRFRTLKHNDVGESTLETYEQRVRKALEYYASYLENGYSMPSDLTRGRRASRSRRDVKQPSSEPLDGSENRKKSDVETPKPASHTPSEPDGLIGYKFPLRPSLLVEVALPVNLTKAEAARLSSFLDSLAFAD